MTWASCRAKGPWLDPDKTGRLPKGPPSRGERAEPRRPRRGRGRGWGQAAQPASLGRCGPGVQGPGSKASSLPSLKNEGSTVTWSFGEDTGEGARRSARSEE